MKPGANKLEWDESPKYEGPGGHPSRVDPAGERTATEDHPAEDPEPVLEEVSAKETRPQAHGACAAELGAEWDVARGTQEPGLALVRHLLIPTRGDLTRERGARARRPLPRKIQHAEHRLQLVEARATLAERSQRARQCGGRDILEHEISREHGHPLAGSIPLPASPLRILGLTCADEGDDPAFRGRIGGRNPDERRTCMEHHVQVSLRPCGGGLDP